MQMQSVSGKIPVIQQKRGTKTEPLFVITNAAVFYCRCMKKECRIPKTNIGLALNAVTQQPEAQHTRHNKAGFSVHVWS